MAGFEQYMNINVAIQAAAGAKEYFEFVAPVALANFIYLYDWVIYERKRGRMRRVRGRHYSENFNPNSIQCIRWLLLHVTINVRFMRRGAMHLLHNLVDVLRHLYVYNIWFRWACILLACSTLWFIFEQDITPTIESNGFFSFVFLAAFWCILHHRAKMHIYSNPRGGYMCYCGVCLELYSTSIAGCIRKTGAVLHLMINKRFVLTRDAPNMRSGTNLNCKESARSRFIRRYCILMISVFCFVMCCSTTIVNAGWLSMAAWNAFQSHADVRCLLFSNTLSATQPFT